MVQKRIWMVGGVEGFLQAFHTRGQDTPVHVRLFDVGQGNCVLVRYQEEAVMTDCGANALTYTGRPSQKTSAHRSAKS